jgi:phenylalanyl-tRNA synthetase alpha chain
LYIDKDVSFADLKQTLLYFTKEMFGKSQNSFTTQVTFSSPNQCRNRYLLGLKPETDYRITKGTGWLEIGGCGMVDQMYLKNCGINPDSGCFSEWELRRIANLLLSNWRYQNVL